MSKINYHEARKTLSEVCKGYLAHNQTQLNALKPISPTIPAEFFFMRARAGRSGFRGWISCKYAEIMDEIFWMNRSGYRTSHPLDYYEEHYPPCKLKTTFFPDELKILSLGETTDIDPYDVYPDIAPYDVYPDVNPRGVLDRLTVLVGLFDYVMIEENRELDFKKNFEAYKFKNTGDFLCSGDEPLSIKIYKTLKQLKEVVCFVNETLPKYQAHGIGRMINIFEKSFPTFEGYIKNVAVRELKCTLDNLELSDEDSVKAFAFQLQNKEVLNILEKNRQSQTEHILKVISVALIAVGIGIIPTVVLAAKRLYDSGGTSINFFKPLSMNLCEDASGITAEVEQDLKMS